MKIRRKLFFFVEKDWIPSRGVIAAFKVRRYIRYRDNITVIHGSGARFASWLHCYRARIKKCYKVKVESASRTSINSLDMTLTRHGDHFRAKPFFKPMARKIPLSTQSIHPFGVHNWPLAEIRRLASLSCDHGEFIKARAIMVEDFRSNKHDPAMCDLIADFDPFRRECVPAVNASIFPRVADGRTFTLVLPYHPSLASVGLPSVINELIDDWMPSLIFLVGPVRIRLAWTLLGSPLFVCLRKRRSS